MKVSKEVRIGTLVSVAALVLFTGFYFLKGSSFMSDERTYYCYYSNAQGLVKSANVEVNGLEVGHVTELELTDDNRIKATISIDKSIELHAGTVASISQSNILNGKIIKIDLGRGQGLIKPGETIPASEKGSILDDLSAQAGPMVNSLKVTIATLDTALNNINLLMGADNRMAIAATLASLNTTAANLSKISAALATEGEDMKGIIRNTNQFTATLAKNDDTLTRMMSNINMLTGQLSRAPIEKTVTDLQASVNQLQGVLNKINSNQGSLGMLVNDKALYNNMSSSLKSLDALLADLKEHPSRYINVSVFGGKKK
ncbi:MAG: MCE family protein [Chitinophagia bacterium]|nr:MCE family protein [Chitinophagia bacterium]